MLKKFLTCLIISGAFLLSSCDSSEVPDIPDDTHEEDKLTFTIEIEGEGTVKAFKDGVSLTNENFDENVDAGDKVTITISPDSGYLLSTVSFNNESLIKTGANYTFIAVEGENKLSVTFEAIETSAEDFEYLILNDNEVAITSFENSSPSMPDPVIIPDEVSIDSKTYKVTTLNDGIFSNQLVEGLEIGKNVTTISTQAFANMYSLKEFSVDDENTTFRTIDGVLYSFDQTELIKMPIAYSKDSLAVDSKVTTIKECAFEDCLNIKSVTLPDGLTTIENSAFIDATGLSSINFPTSLKEIGDYAFRNNHALKSIELNEGLEVLGTGAFYQCDIQTASFPSTLTEIPAFSFYFCRNLNTVRFSEGLEEIGEQAFIATSIKELDLPDSLNYIGVSAFELCSSLKTVNFNEGLEEIDSFAFTRANNISAISLPSSITKIGYNPFSGITSLGYNNNFVVDENNPNFEVIDGVLYTKGEKKKLICYPFGKLDKSYTILDGTTYLAVDSFAYHNSLLYITLPRSITDIDSAFRVMYSEMTNKPSLTITYLGTTDEFVKINLHGENGHWYEDTSITNNQVQCSDGLIWL